MGDYDYDWQEYKDGVAMGYIWPDGSYREPEFEPPDDWTEPLNRLPHTCGVDPAGICDACDVAEDAKAVRREDR